LQLHDHCPTISHANSTQPASPEDESLDIGEGAEVVFDDESNVIQIEDVLSGMQATVAATPHQLALPPPLPPRENKTKADVPVAPKQSHFPTRVIVLSLLVAAIAVGVWLVLPGDNRAPSKPALAPTYKRTEAAAKVETNTEAKTAPSVVIDAGTKAPAELAGPSASAPAAEAPTAAVESEEEEETLLKNAEPDDHERVIDEDEGVKTSKKKSATAPSKPSAEPVSVHVVSTPEGAVVSLGRRVFGRAPMNLRFRPGITFELTLVKKGYLPATKRFTATGKANQTVRVALKKRPTQAPRKSLFRRIFGGR
jgi:hypothetical protein